MKLIVGMLLLCPLTYAASCPTKQAKDSNALIQIEQKWARSLEQRDTTTLGCILGDEFEDADIDGTLTDRASTLTKSANHPSVHHELSELSAHVHGDFGYIRGLATARDLRGLIKMKVRFTDIYVYREGRWQCVAGQESLVPAGS